LLYYLIPLQLGAIFQGQPGNEYFVLDSRLTQAPQIGNDFIDFYLLGDFIYKDERCSKYVDNNLHFYNTKDYSQLVIGESAASCVMNQLGKS
jgi:hypothetical protein